MLFALLDAIASELLEIVEQLHAGMYIAFPINVVYMSTHGGFGQDKLLSDVGGVSSAKQKLEYFLLAIGKACLCGVACDRRCPVGQCLLAFADRSVIGDSGEHKAVFIGEGQRCREHDGEQGKRGQRFCGRKAQVGEMRVGGREASELSKHHAARACKTPERYGFEQRRIIGFDDVAVVVVGEHLEQQVA